MGQIKLKGHCGTPSKYFVELSDFLFIFFSGGLGKSPKMVDGLSEKGNENGLRDRGGFATFLLAKQRVSSISMRWPRVSPPTAHLNDPVLLPNS